MRLDKRLQNVWNKPFRVDYGVIILEDFEDKAIRIRLNGLAYCFLVDKEQWIFFCRSLQCLPRMQARKKKAWALLQFPEVQESFQWVHVDFLGPFSLKYSYIYLYIYIYILQVVDVFY